MRLFDRTSKGTPKANEFRLVYEQGLQMGALQAELAALKAEVAALADRLPPAAPAPLDPELVAIVQSLARGDAALYRHLESQAKELAQAGMETRQVVLQLKRGTPVRLPNRD